MAKEKKEPLKLLQALDFVALAQRGTGAPYQTHVVMTANTAVATDGVLSAGALIDESIDAIPHTETLVTALKKCNGVLQLTQLTSERLSIKAGRFKAIVPCVPKAILPDIAPDAWQGPLDNRIRDGFAVLSPFVVENSQRVVTASIMLRNQSMIATNGHVLVEFRHDISLPTGMLVPKLFVNAVLRVKKNIVGYGCSATSFTIFFDDNSWLKTQLYRDKYPDTDAIMARPHKMIPLPELFFEAVSAVVGFSTDSRIRIKPSKLLSHAHESEGASYDCPGLSADITLNAKHLSMLDGVISHMDMNGAGGISYFYGMVKDGVPFLRGALTQFKEDV